MEYLLSKWLMETRQEIEKAKINQNVYLMFEMKKLVKGLQELRDKLLKT